MLDYVNYIKMYFENKNPVDVMLILIFVCPIFAGFLFKYSSKSLKKDVKKIQSDVSFIAALILSIYWMKNIFFNHSKKIYIQIYNKIPKSIINHVNEKPFIVYLVIIPLAAFVIYNILMLIFEGVNNISFYPIFDSVERSLRNKSGLRKRLIGSLFKIPKAICYVIIAAFILNYISILNVSNNLNNYLKDSNYYNYICKKVIFPVTNSKVAKKIPNIIGNSFKIVIKQNNTANIDKDIPKTIVYYNGVTLDEGVLSDERIDEFSVNLVKNEKTTIEKSKKIYDWIVNNIEYDYNKAKLIYNGDYREKSGAIEAFYTRKGICFDYACLFVAMCRANNIKVRIITGKGFNGAAWVNHAWNQVFIEEQNKWINVDTTFGQGGDYFGSLRFMIDHKDAKIAGEWK